MAATKATATEITRKYILDYPELQNQSLARKLCQDYPKLFLNIENARSHVRRQKGAAGVKSRTNAPGKKFREEHNLQGYMEKHGDLFADVPEPALFKKKIPYHVPSTITNMLMLYDVHVPYHNKEAVQLALHYGLDHEVDCIFFGGDFLDMYGVSKYEKERGAWEPEDEICAFLELIGLIRKHFGDIPIILLEGNHETRFTRYLKQNAPAILGMVCNTLQDILLQELTNVTYLDEKRLVKFSHLNIMHGHEFSISGDNPAKMLLRKRMGCCMAGHLHVTDYYDHRTIEGKTIGAWMVAGLLDIDSHWSPQVYNKWQNGFARVTRTDDNEWFRVENKVIERGQIL